MLSNPPLNSVPHSPCARSSWEAPGVSCIDVDTDGDCVAPDAWVAAMPDVRRGKEIMRRLKECAVPGDGESSCFRTSLCLVVTIAMFFTSQLVWSLLSQQWWMAASFRRHTQWPARCWLTRLCL